MLHALHAVVAPAATERLVLLLNHLLQSEPVAQDRLRPHAGRRLELQATDWPRWAPPLPRLAFAITPAGLLEWEPDAPAVPADLQVVVDASQPLQQLPALLAGQAPRLRVEGDAALAGDVNWLLDNLRWDPADDLQRFMGPAAASSLQRVGRGFFAALRQALSLVQSIAGRLGAAGPNAGAAGGWPGR
jgi:ubiquinone biosynthesis protein UbiJ